MFTENPITISFDAINNSHAPVKSLLEYLENSSSKRSASKSGENSQAESEKESSDTRSVLDWLKSIKTSIRDDFTDLIGCLSTVRDINESNLNDILATFVNINDYYNKIIELENVVQWIKDMIEFNGEQRCLLANLNIKRFLFTSKLDFNRSVHLLNHIADSLMIHITKLSMPTDISMRFCRLTLHLLNLVIHFQIPSQRRPKLAYLSTILSILLHADIHPTLSCHALLLDLQALCLSSIYFTSAGYSPLTGEERSKIVPPFPSSSNSSSLYTSGGTATGTATTISSTNDSFKRKDAFCYDRKGSSNSALGDDHGVDPETEDISGHSECNELSWLRGTSVSPCKFGGDPEESANTSLYDMVASSIPSLLESLGPGELRAILSMAVSLYLMRCWRENLDGILSEHQHEALVEKLCENASHWPGYQRFETLHVHHPQSASVDDKGYTVGGKQLDLPALCELMLLEAMTSFFTFEPRMDCLDLRVWHMGKTIPTKQEGVPAIGTTTDNRLFVHSPQLLSRMAFSVVKEFGNSLLQHKPVHALAALETCAVLLLRQGRSSEMRRLTKELAILAASVGDCDRAVRHCSLVFPAYQLSDINEMCFVAELLMRQHCDRGSFELAVAEARRTLEYIRLLLFSI